MSETFDREECFQMLEAFDAAIALAVEQDDLDLAELFAAAREIIFEKVFGHLPEGE